MQEARDLTSNAEEAKLNAEEANKMAVADDFPFLSRRAPPG
jgi:hypothetical protein